MTYETGVGIAFLWWLWGVVWALVMLNSQFARNLHKLGMRLSMLTLQPKPMSIADRNRSAMASVGRFALLALIGLPFVLLSWIWVAMRVGQLLWGRYKQAGRPAAAKEAEWKLKNLDLNFEQLVETLYSMNAAMGLEKRPYEAFRDELAASARGE